MQQPTTESQPAAFLVGSAVDASLLNLHPGPYTSTHPVVIVRSEPEPGTENRHGVCNSWLTDKTMSTKLMFSQPKRAVLTPEGVYAALVTKVAVNPKKGTEEPETIELEFTLNALNQHITRKYPATIKRRSPLLRDSKIILGRGPNREELEQGFDPAILKDRSCRVNVAHRPGADGRPQSQSITVMAPETTPVAAAPAAAEAVAAVAA